MIADTLAICSSDVFRRRPNVAKTFASQKMTKNVYFLNKVNIIVPLAFFLH